MSPARDDRKICLSHAPTTYYNVKHQFMRPMRLAVAIVLLSLLATGCHRSGASIQLLMAGTWEIDRGDGIHGTLIIAPDGNWKSQSTGYQNGFTLMLEGTALVKDGFWIETVTKNNITNAVPRVTHSRIVRIDAHEFVMRPDGWHFDIVAKKVAE